MPRSRPLATLLVASILGVAAPARAVDVSGTLITSYADRQGGTGLTAGTSNNQFRLVQANLRLTDDFTEYNRYGISITSGQGAALTISEAWTEMSGLPYDGAITLGRFYKPLAAPLQTVGLSYSALMFHSNPVIGAKLGMEYYPWRWEAGVVNNYDLSATGAIISNSTAFSRPIPTPSVEPSQTREAYAFLGWRDGGEWGSLDLTANYAYGKFSRRDQAVLDGIAGLLPAPHRNRSDRYLMEFSADYTYGPWRLNGDYARTREGRLDETVYNVDGSYRIGKANFIIGYDRLQNNANIRPLEVPATWERDRLTYGINYELTSNLQLALEYEHNREDITNVTPDRRNVRDGIPNDGIIFQMMASF